jgi:pimeloyl-ACP methyl ester carboxylesterase
MDRDLKTIPADSYTSSWQSNGTVKSLTLKSGFLRYLDIGHGQPMLLIHTLRTQLDYFQKLVPLLQDRYRVLAIDLPGHGYSSIPAHARFDEPFFRESVIEFVEKLDLEKLIVLGESIGGVLALVLAATIPNRINRVFSLNPYDYGEKFGGGIRRSRYGFIIGLFALFGGFTIETSFALKLVLSGGFADPTNLPQSLFLELVRAGHQKGYRRAEYLLYKHWRSWLGAAKFYHMIRVPVTLVYGEQDWSNPREREDRKMQIPGMQFVVLPAAGHFSALEVPTRLAEIVG